jgi:hypothetical protein
MSSKQHAKILCIQQVLEAEGITSSASRRHYKFSILAAFFHH